jgi:2-methylcitrate dehydratase PrpD
MVFAGYPELKMGPTEAVAAFVAETPDEALPQGVVEAAKIAILDGVGCLLAGSAEPLGGIVADYVRRLGGNPASTVAGHDFKTNPFMAAFANGTFLHALDFEVQGIPPAHGTSAILPPALALGEAFGAGGKAVIGAYAIGWEVQQRLRAASARYRGRMFHPPGIFGPMGAAASAARILGLDRGQVRMALGIAASRTGGLFANNGTMVKSTHPGNAARMGVEAALLAAAGFVGNDAILEAHQGYVETFFEGEFDWELLTRDLGSAWNLVNPGFIIKRFPAEIYLQWAAEAVLELRAAHDFRPEEMEYLEVELPALRPELSRPRPKSGLDGKFSFEYCAAVALATGRVDIDSFTDATRFRPEVEAALAKVRLKADPNIPMDLAHMFARATVRLKDGRRLTAECRRFRGLPDNPMSRAERLTKFRACAGRVLDGARCEQLIETVESLEKLDDIRALTALLSKPGA